MKEYAVQTFAMLVDEKILTFGEGMVTYTRPRQVPNKTAPKVLSRAGISGSTTNEPTGSDRLVLGTTMMYLREDAMAGHPHGVYIHGGFKESYHLNSWR